MSANTKHTRGPWMAAAKPSSIVGWPICGPNGRMIGDVVIINRQGNGDEEKFKAYYAECEANARLIAAAPDLLDVLKTTRGNIVSLGDAGLPGPLAEWLRVVEEAIAKSEGAQ